MAVPLACIVALMSARAAIAADEKFLLESDPIAGSPLRNIFSLAALYNEDDAFAVQVGAIFAVGTKSHLDFGLGYTSSPREADAANTYRGNVGFEHEFGTLGLTFGYEYWGDRDLIDTHKLYGSLYLDGDLGRIALLAEHREIDLRFEIPLGARGFVDDSKSAQSDGLGLSARYRSQKVDLYANGTHYDFDSDIGNLGSLIDFSRVPPPLRPALIERLQQLAFNLRRLNASSLSLANSFLNYSIAAGADIKFGEFALNIEVSQEQIVVDDSIINGVSFGLLHSFGKSSDIEYRLGVTDDEIVGSSVYGGVTFYWYR
jgi:hypothetical protein